MGVLSMHKISLFLATAHFPNSSTKVGTGCPAKVGGPIVFGVTLECGGQLWMLRRSV